jgi:hypothetical protein
MPDSLGGQVIPVPYHHDPVRTALSQHEGTTMQISTLSILRKKNRYRKER